MHTGQRRRRGTPSLSNSEGSWKSPVILACGGGGLGAGGRGWPRSGAAGGADATSVGTGTGRGTGYGSGTGYGCGTGTGWGQAPGPAWYEDGLYRRPQQPAPAKPARNKQTVMSFFMWLLFKVRDNRMETELGFPFTFSF